MAISEISETIQHLCRAVLLQDGAGLTDRQLLEDYINRREEAALAALVRRHGPMVWGVCRRVLRSYHDVEDAFQATFLVLVRKAASIASPELLANWLYGVAHQTALKARATTAKRKARERQVTEMPEPAVTEQDLWNDLQPLLDEELSRLPNKYRVAIVLCDLEGKTRKEAARQLGVPDGTLAARLTRGRVMLAKRLARHGLAVSGGALAGLLSHSAASACVPTEVVSGTIKAASLFAAGQTAAAGMISVKATALTAGVLKTMLMSKIKSVMGVLLVVGGFAAGIGAGGWTYKTQAAERPDAPIAGVAPVRASDESQPEQPWTAAFPSLKLGALGSYGEKPQPKTIELKGTLKLGEPQDADAKLKRLVKAKAEEVHLALLKGDVAKVVDHAHPEWVKKEGGREKMIATLKGVADDLKAKGFTFQALKVKEPNEIVADGTKRFAVVPYVVELKGMGGKVTQEAFVIGISGDQGKNWTFVSGDTAKIKMLLPAILPEALKLPESRQAVFEKDG